MASGETQLLPAPLRHRFYILRSDDLRFRRLVLGHPVRKDQLDAIAGREFVETEKGTTEDGPVAGDDDPTVLARKWLLGPVTQASLKVIRVYPFHDGHVHPDPRYDYAADLKRGISPEFLLPSTRPISDLFWEDPRRLRRPSRRRAAAARAGEKNQDEDESHGRQNSDVTVSPRSYECRLPT